MMGIGPSRATILLACILAFSSLLPACGEEVEFDPFLGRQVPTGGDGLALAYGGWLSSHAADPAAAEALRRCFFLDADASRLLETATRLFDSPGAPQAADLLDRTARLAEMLGRTELAESLYRRAYVSGRLAAALLSSIGLLSEMGDVMKAKELAGLPLATEGRAAALAPYLFDVAAGDDWPQIPADPAVRPSAAYFSYLHWRDRGDTSRAAQALSILEKEFPLSPEYALCRKSERIRVASTPGAFLTSDGTDSGVKAAATTAPGAAAKASRGALVVQTGSFTVRDNAEDMVKELRRIGYTPAIREIVRDGRKFFAVMAAVGLSMEEGQAVINALKEKNYEGFLRSDPGE